MATTILAIGLLVVCAAVASSAAAMPPLPLTMDDSSTTTLSRAFHSASCPDLEGTVRAAVQAARGQDVQVTAGLLRIFFHDCFPQGCDASILLDGPNSEKLMPQNQGLQQRALNLIEEIRGSVHSRCGATVSCADILALATRDAVHLAGGPLIPMPLGRSDSLDPAPAWIVSNLPRPDATADALLNSFNSKGLDSAADLVALSGAHTVGKARCSSFADRTRSPNDGFTWGLAGYCAGSSDGSRQHNLDVLTPDVFDNRYFVDLTNRTGVLTSDQGLYNDGRTKWLVDAFAKDQNWFFFQFAQSMVKMSQMKGTRPGPIRRNCFRPNAGVNLETAGDEGLLAASA